MHRAIDVCDESLVWPEDQAANQKLTFGELVSEAQASHKARGKGQQQQRKEKQRDPQRPAEAETANVTAKSITWHDRALNKEQTTAVLRLTNKTQRAGDGSAPILMFGAFGTGGIIYLFFSPFIHPPIHRQDKNACGGYSTDTISSQPRHNENSCLRTG